MSMFSIGLSGLSSTQKALEVTSNNIANAGTAGYKTTSTEFSALYSGGQRSGVNVSATSENFEKSGNLVGTGQSLDLAITGKGFFVISENGRLAYTQAGQFKMDGSDRSIITNNGDKLQGYGIDDQGNLVPGVLTDLKVEAANIPAKASTNINFSMNLNSGSDLIPYPATFNPKDGTGFNYSQSSEVFDSLGNSHTVTQYFNHTGANTWQVLYYVDGKPLTPAQLGNPAGSTVTAVNALDDTGATVGTEALTVRFGADGQMYPLNVVPPAAVPAGDNNKTDPLNLRELSINLPLTNGAAPLSIKLDLTPIRHF